MKKLLSIMCVTVQILTFTFQAHANEATVRNEVQQDIVAPVQMSNDDRLCVDGTSPLGKMRIDYWVDFECSYCRVNDILQFQQANQDTCVVIRHTPSLGTESMPKALAYEALLHVNASAANTFWSEIYPQNGISKPYQRPLIDALDSIVMPVEVFEPVIDSVVPIIENDNAFSETILSYTPTFVIEGIRFTACDFNAEQLERVIPIAQAARNGDNEAKEQILQIIINGINDDFLL